ncbi:membrane protein [Psychromonas marina]|uniref:Membrane protein n=1 Tax=Psychromonas marina TaxID=88364 RepID=A0ABQ6DVY7_9GAMM|nr:DMT family transporter [Psychromonas marina]GLS89260.1 membrane protein [Psychromonas marina]
MNKTLLWMTGTICSFTLMAVAGRELGNLNTFQILFFRSLLGLIVISLIIFSINKQQYFKTTQFKGHILRNLFHFLGQYGWFVGLATLPLAQVFAIEFTVPFWTAIIASIFLKERLNSSKIIAIIVAFIGVLFIVKPSVTHIDNASLIVLAAAVFYACAHSTTKMLSKNNHALTILFYMCLIQLPLGGVLMLSHWTAPNLVEWGWIGVVSLAALTAHFCMTKAMLTSTVTTVVTLDFMRLPLVAIVAFLLYQEPFGLLSIFGTVLIFCAMLLNFKTPKVNR